MGTKNADKKRVMIVFAVGLVLLLLQHRFVGLYYDDYGNASLSYGYTAPNVNGTNWHIKDILEWANWCYNNWGGRILYAVVALMPLTRNGALPFMMVQAVVISLILYISYKIICDSCSKTSTWKLAVLLIVMYMMIGQDIHKFGTYWASASVLYVWPLLPFFLSVYIYNRWDILTENGKKFAIALNVIQCVFVFLATFSQEQVGASVVVYYFLMVTIKHWKHWKNHLKQDLPTIIVSIISYCVLFFSPGNFVRLESTEFSKKSFFEKIAYNYPKVIGCFFTKGLQWLNILLAVIAVYTAYKLYKKNNKFILLIITNAACLGLSLIDLKNNLFSTGTVGIACGSCFLVSVVLTLTIYFAFCNRHSMIALMYAGGASVGCLVMSPTINLRSYLEYIFVAFIITGCVCVDIDQSEKNISENMVVHMFLLGLIILGVRNYTTILKGYYQNYPNLEYNDNVLRNVTDENIVFLKKLPNAEYRVQMAYDEGFDYIEKWMKEYYDLPQNTNFIWTDYISESGLKFAGDFYEDGWFGKSGEIILTDVDSVQTLTLKLENVLKSNTLNVTINGNTRSYPINEDTDTISIDLPKNNEYTVIELAVDDIVIPYEEGTGEDLRKLSMMIKVESIE